MMKKVIALLLGMLAATIVAMKKISFVVFLVVAIFVIASAQQTRPANDPAPPRLTFAFELRARVGNPVEVGQVTQ